MAKPPAGKKSAPPSKKSTPKPAAPEKAAGKAAPVPKASPTPTNKAPAKKAPATSKARPKPQNQETEKPAPHAYDMSVAADAVLEGIAEGGSLREVCGKPGLPSVTTFMRWLADERNENLRERYARARELQAEYMAEDILSIADEECTMVKADKHGTQDDDGQGNTEVVFDSTAVQRNRLRVDTRKWLLSKLAPKKYGDKVLNEHTGANGGAIKVASTVTFVRPTARPEDDE